MNKDKRKKNPLKGMTKEQMDALTQELKDKIVTLEAERQELVHELSGLSARKAFLDEVTEQNIRFLKGKNLL